MAIYIVYRKIDKTAFVHTFKEINWVWLFPAIIFFVISKLFSAIRMSGLLANIGIQLPHKTTLKIYFKGMFYNLFLPGGIGGDAFKTYVVNTYKQAPLKKILGTMLYDRISGLIILCFLATLGSTFLLNDYTLILGIGALLIIPSGYLFTMFLFPSHKKNFSSSQLYSLGVQMAQIVSVICILKSIHIHLADYMNYLFLFLISSVASVLPFTVGGAGARELVFLYGEKILPVHAETGIAVGILFFLITALTSLFSAFITLKNNNA